MIPPLCDCIITDKCFADFYKRVDIHEKAGKISDGFDSDPVSPDRHDRMRKNTVQTFNTDSNNLVVPTGTRTDSEEPKVPKSIVYWSPTRAQKDKYTLEEALEKYAIVVGKPTLIYTRSDELRMNHESSEPLLTFSDSLITYEQMFI